MELFALTTENLSYYYILKEIFAPISVKVSEKIYPVSFRLIELEKAVVEGAGATGLAAVMAGMLPELRGKKSALKMNH